MSLFLFIEYGRLILEVEIMSGLIEFLTTEEMILYWWGLHPFYIL